MINSLEDFNARLIDSSFIEVENMDTIPRQGQDSIISQPNKTIDTLSNQSQL